jgi:multidrug resistance efflux pump
MNRLTTPAAANGLRGFLARNWKPAVGGALLLVVALGYGMSRRPVAQAATNNGERTFTVVRRDFVRSIRLHGTTAAVESFPITVPRMAGQPGGTLLITRMAASGASVKPGDPIVEFDRQNQIRNALDRRAEYLDLEEQIKKKLAEQDAARAKDQTDLTQARNDVEKWRWEIRRNEVISRIDAEKNRQRLEESEARLKQLETTKELKLTAYAADLRILEIRRDRARNAMRWAEGNSEKMSIRSPIEGLVVINVVWKGGSMGEVLEGDEVRPGQSIMQVVNPKSMEVRARVNQADMPYLKAGQRAEFRLDAFPTLTFSGKLDRVAAMGTASGMNAFVRNFAAVFSVQGTDAHLLPDLAAAIDAELARLPGSLVVPQDALQRADGKTYVFVRRGGDWERREVQLAAESGVEAAVASGVAEGDVVRRGDSRRGTT